MAGSGHSTPDCFQDVFPGRCGGENVKQEKPVCPAARIYLSNQQQYPPMMKSRKTKCSAQVNPQQGTRQEACAAPSRSGKKSCPEDTGKKCNYKPKTCNSPSSSQPPCPCTCPREEKEPRESPCPKKKAAEGKSCTKIGKSAYADGRRPDEIEGRTCNIKSSYRVPNDNVNHIEGCTCLEGTPAEVSLVGLERLGLGKTTPDSFVTDVKQQQCLAGRRKGERQEKRPQSTCQQPNQAEEAMPAPCLKPRPQDQLCEAIKKQSSCPAPRTKPSNTCYPPMLKQAIADSRRPRPIQPEYGVSACPKNTGVNLGTCPPMSFRGPPAIPQQQQQECGLGGAGKDDKQQEPFHLQHMVSPITPREFVDAFSSSSADENGAGANAMDGDIEGQEDAAGEENDEDDAGAGGYSSSSDNAGIGGAGQNIDDFEMGGTQKGPCNTRNYYDNAYEQGGGQATEQQYPGPCNIGNGSYMPHSYQQGTQYSGFGGVNASPCAPQNSPNFNQPGQSYFPGFGGQFPGAPFNTPIEGYVPPPVGIFPTAFNPSQACPVSYGQSQASYNQMQPNQQYMSPRGPGTQPSPDGSPQPLYGRLLWTDEVAPPRPRQRQTPEARPAEGNRRMTFDQRSRFSQSFNDQCPMPTTSTPINIHSPPASPRFLLSPIPHATNTTFNTSGQQWMQIGPGSPCQRLPAGGENASRRVDSTNESREWMSLQSFKGSTLGKSSCNRADQSSDVKRRMDQDSTNESMTPSPACRRRHMDQDSMMTNESMPSSTLRRRPVDPDSTLTNESLTASMVARFGDESPKWAELPKWRELPKSTRFRRNISGLSDASERSCYK